MNAGNDLLSRIEPEVTTNDLTASKSRFAEIDAVVNLMCLISFLATDADNSESKFTSLHEEENTVTESIEDENSLTEYPNLPAP